MSFGGWGRVRDTGGKTDCCSKGGIAIGAGSITGRTDLGRVWGFCVKLVFGSAREGADGVEAIVGWLSVRFECFCFFEMGPSEPEAPDSSRFLGTEGGAISRLDGCTVVIMEGLNLDGELDPRSTTSCGLVHFE